MHPYEFEAERFSRWLSYVLRHNPGRYDLTPDQHGYVDLEVVLQIATRRYPQVNLERLRGLIDTEGRSRFDVTAGRIRARYGHSIPVQPVGGPVQPPARLYHGTDPERSELILREGLAPMNRRMVHLSLSAEDAMAVARRHSAAPTVLAVRAHEAHAGGIAFYHEGKVYLASHIPAAFLMIESDSTIAPAPPHATDAP